MQLHIDLMSPFKKTSFVGINLLSYKMNDREASNIIDDFETVYNLSNN